MTEEYKIIDIPAQPCVFIRRTLASDKLGEFYMEVLPKVFQFAAQHGVARSAPFGRYPEWGQNGGTVEAGIATRSKVDGEGEILSGTLGGSRAVMGTHVGAYEGLPDAFSRLFAWCREHGHEPSGACWELYVDDPESKPANEVRTELYIPIK